MPASTEIIFDLDKMSLDTDNVFYYLDGDVNIVDDLITGGSNNTLSANQGKILNNRLTIVENKIKNLNTNDSMTDEEVRQVLNQVFGDI
jgi:hypothetical protein